MAKAATNKRRTKTASQFDPATMAAVCDRVACGESLRRVARDMGYAEQTVRGWISRDIGGSFAQYARARDLQADSHADMIVDACRDVLDGTLPPDQARVAIDGYKWAASKLKPATYGDRVDHRLTASDGLLSALQGIERRLKDVTPSPALIEHEPQETKQG